MKAIVPFKCLTSLLFLVGCGSQDSGSENPFRTGSEQLFNEKNPVVEETPADTGTTTDTTTNTTTDTTTNTNTGNTNTGTVTTDPGDTTQFAVLRLGVSTDSTYSNGYLVPVFVDIRKASDGSLVRSIALPTATSGSNNPLLLPWSASSGTNEGLLSRSTDGHYLLLAGYNGATTDNSTTGKARIIARINASDTVDTSTTLAAASSFATNIISVASVDGSAYWIGGRGTTTLTGVQYVAHGGTTPVALPTTQPDRVKAVNIFNNQLYTVGYSTSTSGGYTAVGVYSVGTGLPTTSGQSLTQLASITAASTFPSGLLMFDTDSNGVLDVMYVSDTGTTANTGGIRKYTSTNGTTWTSVFTITDNIDGAQGLTGYIYNGSIILLATQTAYNRTTYTTTRIIKYADTAASTSAPSGTVLVTPDSNTSLRGLSLVPN